MVMMKRATVTLMMVAVESRSEAMAGMEGRKMEAVMAGCVSMSGQEHGDGRLT
jgi:hypothetical protein